LTEVGLREGLLQELAMHNVQTDLKRLQLALEALSVDLDAIERRHHYPRGRN